MNENYPAETAAKSISGSALMRRPDITLRQNIDEQITRAEKQVAELKAARERMEKSNILDMRIDDIQAAMRW